MSGPNDPLGVVDAHGRVRGVEGLRVADASVFPTLMRANTHLPVMMVAEKMADHVKSDWTRPRDAVDVHAIGGNSLG
jgi:5-(hydroxymethyl)furfural/furfural oxidase